MVNFSFTWEIGYICTYLHCIRVHILSKNVETVMYTFPFSTCLFSCTQAISSPVSSLENFYIRSTKQIHIFTYKQKIFHKVGFFILSPFATNRRCSVVYSFQNQWKNIQNTIMALLMMIEYSRKTRRLKLWAMNQLCLFFHTYV